MLRFLAELRFLSLPQIARLCCPAARQDLSEKRARRHMRALFDGGLVDVLPVSRAALSPPGAPNDASLLYGSAPNVYAPTARALETLHQSGLVDNQGAGRMKPGYGPKNSLFLAHELGVRDVRVWLELAARRHGDQAVKEWHDGPEAAIDLGRTQAPKTLRPDAWFVYRLGEREGRDLVLVGFVEFDRATERGERRWSEKLDAYRSLFSGPRLRETTGYVQARVLVVCPTAARRRNLADLIARKAEPPVADRFWLAESALLDRPELPSSMWQKPGSRVLQPLVSAGLVQQA